MTPTDRLRIHGPIEPAHRDPWIIRAWRAADTFDRCIAVGMAALTASIVTYSIWSSL